MTFLSLSISMFVFLSIFGPLLGMSMRTPGDPCTSSVVAPNRVQYTCVDEGGSTFNDEATYRIRTTYTFEGLPDFPLVRWTGFEREESP